MPVFFFFVEGEFTHFSHFPDKTHIDVPAQEPWFELWRETFFTVQFPSDHEYTRHFLGCLIVLSSSDVNPLDSAQQLTAKVQMLQNGSTPPQSKLPKWFAPTDALNCYVMLHDGCTGDISKAQQAFESLQLTFGENRCFLLQINSMTTADVDATTTDPWLKYLKQHPRGEQSGNEASGGASAPRTPQEPVVGGGMLAPAPPPYTETPISTTSGIASEEVVDHPLSPVQEHATEAIVSFPVFFCGQIYLCAFFF